MQPAKRTTFAELTDKIARDKAIYDALSDEERAEVDAYNAKIRGKPIAEILAAGPNPMVRFRERAARAEEGR